LESQFQLLKEERDSDTRKITTQFQYMNDFLSKAQINLEKGEEFIIYQQKVQREMEQMKLDFENLKTENKNLKEEMEAKEQKFEIKENEIKLLNENIKELLTEKEIQIQMIAKKEEEIGKLKMQKKELTNSYKKIVTETQNSPNGPIRKSQPKMFVNESKVETKNGTQEEINSLVKSISIRAKNNDSSLTKISLQKKNLTDLDVSFLVESLLENKYVTGLDLSENSIKGASMDDIEILLSKTKTLEELIFDDCPIETKRIQQLIKALEKNTTLTQV
jgi:chromosome segregation ATPase